MNTQGSEELHCHNEQRSCLHWNGGSIYSMQYESVHISMTFEPLKPTPFVHVFKLWRASWSETAETASAGPSTGAAAAVLLLSAALTAALALPFLTLSVRA